MTAIHITYCELNHSFLFKTCRSMAAEGGGGEGGESQSLQTTPTWALATVCFIFIFLGLVVEHLIHFACRWLKRHKKTALYEATEKLKSVLMLLGFISLILNVTQRSISEICIPNKVASSMLPCRGHTFETTKVVEEHLSRNVVRQDGNFPNEYFSHHERQLAGSDSSSLDHCGSKGMTSLMSEEGLTQLNIFMFVLAAMQIVSSVATMGLGRAKMKWWKTWEDETKTVEYMVSNDPEKFRLTRDTTFGRRHLNTWATNSPVLWIVCFLRQFFRSVAKVDYFTLRYGFISTHMSINNSFNFRKYIQRSLEDDFKAVIGISPFMWLLAIIFLLVDVHGWNAYLWVSFLPLLMVLLIGTKLEIIVARMALQLTDQKTVVKGTPLVQPRNSLFWFSRPQLVLTLLHTALFLNAFELSFLIWVTWQFGIDSCYHDNLANIIVRVVLAVMVQVLCSYITLPLYALVTQMGSQYKSAILEEHTIHALKQWHTDAKQKGTGEGSPKPGIQEDSSIILSNSRPTSPDVSYHRNPTRAQFSSRYGGEITEEMDSGYKDHLENENRQHAQDDIEFWPRV